MKHFHSVWIWRYFCLYFVILYLNWQKRRQTWSILLHRMYFSYALSGSLLLSNQSAIRRYHNNAVNMLLSAARSWRVFSKFLVPNCVRTYQPNRFLVRQGRLYFLMQTKFLGANFVLTFLRRPLFTINWFRNIVLHFIADKSPCHALTPHICFLFIKVSV
jgi:hypothetical protein